MNAAQTLKAITSAMADASLSGRDDEKVIDRIREIVGTGAKGRRIVQIAAVGHENDQMWQGRTELFALGDDSTAWYQIHGEASWVPIPDIPQDAPAESLDPIAELEAMGARLVINHGANLVWFVEGFTDEPMGGSVSLSDLRAAAARLLARVRGKK